MVDQRYSNDTNQEPYTFFQGELDPCGVIIKQIYGRHTDSCSRLVWIVYSDKNDNITGWVNPNDHNEIKEDEYHNRICDLEPLLSIAKSRIKAKTIKRKEVPETLIAKSIELAYSNDINKAEKALSQALLSINFSIQVSGKIDYFVGCSLIIFMQIFLILGSHFASTSGFISGYWNNLVTIITFGAIGALLSVSVNSGKLWFEPDSPASMNRFAGALRIVIGLLSALIVYVAIESEFLMGFTTRIAAQNGEELTVATSWITRFIAIISGFSETYVPDLIDRVSRNSMDTQLFRTTDPEVEKETKSSNR